MLFFSSLHVDKGGSDMMLQDCVDDEYHDTGYGYGSVDIMPERARLCPPADLNVPILVVCYTNHALDQFLEGILKFCPKKGKFCGPIMVGLCISS